jgi:hypothetical protein
VTLGRVLRSRVVVTMRDRVTRWSLAAVLMAAALVNGYLAASESVLWPLALALLWVGLAAGLLSVEAPKPVEPRRAVRRAPSRNPARV